VSITSRRLVFAAGLTVSGFLAAVAGFRLAACGVPVVWVVACALALHTTLMSLFLRLAQAVGATTYRCRAAGCDFKVTIREVDAGENRRWQEIAATHPRHL
jgi:hypothetical protein